jgi:hypothetical protein
MKRWLVRYTQAGEVLSIERGLTALVGAGQSQIESHDEQDNRFFCDAIDELGALARFMKAWGKHKTKEQDQ